MESPTLNINKVIDEAKFILSLEGTVLVSQSLSLMVMILLFMAWLYRYSWGAVTAVQAGFLASAALFGMMFGA